MTVGEEPPSAPGIGPMSGSGAMLSGLSRLEGRR